MPAFSATGHFCAHRGRHRRSWVVRVAQHDDIEDRAILRARDSVALSQIGAEEQSQPAQRNLRFVRASEVMGKDVNDPTGRDLGEIHDVVVNLANGDIRYAVLEFDQSWSLKEKLFAFPLRAFQVGTRWTDDLVLNVSRTR